MLPCRIQLRMLTILAVMLLSNGVFSPLQSTATPSAATNPSPATTQPATTAPVANSQDTSSASAETTRAPEKIEGKKVSLVRGVLKRVDPIHDQLLVSTFGGGQLRIAFDGRTQLLAENKSTRLDTLPAGSVVSVDTVMDEGKLFARSVRTGTSASAELDGQITQYDAGKSEIALRDPMSPHTVVLHITPGTVVINQGQPASAQALSSGMLVRVTVDAARHTAQKVEILAARGSSFTFQGRVVAVDLRSHVLSLLNETDQSIHELAIGSLDIGSVGLLREGAEINVQAEFDGEHYNARSVSLVPHNP